MKADELMAASKEIISLLRSKRALNNDEICMVCRTVIEMMP